MRQILVRSLLGAALLATLVVGVGFRNAAPTIRVEPAPDWTALFERSSGWLGADGIYSIPLSGVDAPGTAARTRTAFVFSDTLVGQVLGGHVQAGAVLVNNSGALLDGAQPDPARTQFYVARDGGQERALFVPSTPHAQAGEWYWLGDGFVDQARGNTTYLFANRMTRTGPGTWGFAQVGVALLTLPAGGAPPFANQIQTETPLFVPAANGRGERSFGGGILVNTAAAGAPHPDGYVYVYGTESLPYNKQLLVARVRPEQFSDFGAWRYWDGARWVADVAQSAALASRVSPELSVSPLADGRYLLVFELDTLSGDVAIRVGDSPTGPWGAAQTIWACPEEHRQPPAYCYNAKAHPHLSAPGELLISYNVNSQGGSLDDLARVYHPRFIRATLQP